MTYKLLPEEGVVVAEGEVTGHRHIVTARPESIVEIAEDNGRFYLKVNKGEAVIKHDKHAEVSFGVGTYVIQKQREYDELVEWREVQD